MDNAEIEARYKSLSARREALASNVMKVNAELNARKRALKDAMEECKKAGFDPDKLSDEIKKMREVIVVKMNVFEAELKAAEDQVRPMLREVG